LKPHPQVHLRSFDRRYRRSTADRHGRPGLELRSFNAHLTRQETALTAANEQNTKLAADLRETDARLKVATQELGQSLGLTQKQLGSPRRRRFWPRTG
jgi:hypothetical protein